MLLPRVRFTAEVITPRKRATSAPPHPNCATVIWQKLMRALLTGRLRLPERNSASATLSRAAALDRSYPWSAWRWRCR